MRFILSLFMVLIVLDTSVYADVIKRRPNQLEILAAKLEEAYEIRDIMEDLHFPRDAKPSSKEFYAMMLKQHDFEYKSRTSDAKPVSVFLADQKIEIPAGTDQVVEYVYIMSGGKVPLDSLNILFNDLTIRAKFKDYLNRKAYPEFAHEWCSVTMNTGAYQIYFFSLLGSAFLIYKQGDLWATDLKNKTNNGFKEVFTQYERQKAFTKPKYGREPEKHRQVSFDYVVQYFTNSPYWNEALNWAKKNYNDVGYFDQIFMWRGKTSPLADFREIKIRDLTELGATPVPASSDARKSQGQITSMPFPELFVDYISILSQGKIDLGTLIDVNSPAQAKLELYNNLLARRDFLSIGYNWSLHNINVDRLPRIPVLESLGIGKILVEGTASWVYNLSDADSFTKIYLKYAAQRREDDKNNTTIPSDRPRKALEFVLTTVSGTAIWNEALQYALYRFEKDPYPSELFTLMKGYDLSTFLNNKDNLSGRTDEQINNLKAASVLEIVYQIEKYLKTIGLKLGTTPSEIERTCQVMHDEAINPLLQQISTKPEE